jgi:hypothetical protein
MLIMTNYYIVTAMCGHVGKGRGILKDLPVRASNARQAAAIARDIPRVKHDYKMAIVGVRRVDYYDYLEQKEINSDDPYFRIQNKRDQFAACGYLETINLKEIAELNRYPKKSKVSERCYVNHYKAFPIETE